MAEFSGRVADVGLDFSSLAGKALEVSLTIASPATTPGYFVVTEPNWRSTDGAGYFRFDVVESAALNPPSSYRFSARWLNPPLPDGSSGGYSYRDFADWDIYITEPGGNVADYASPGIFDVWVGETDDPAYPFWYQPSTTFLYR